MTAAKPESTFAFMTGAITEIDSDQWTWEWDTAASVYIKPYKQLLQNVQKDNTEILWIG
jgi:hypothetical protein